MQYTFLTNSTSKDASTIGFKDAICSPKFRKATWIGVGLFSFQQLTGINGVIPYANRLVVSMNESSDGEFPISPLAATYIMGVMQAVGAMFAYLPITYFGRKPILMFGQLSMAICWFICGLGLILEWYITVFVCLLLFIFFFQST